jgi:elongation factor P
VISTTEFKKGIRILVDGDPFTLEEYTVQTPSARGAASLVRSRLRHVVTGALAEKTFKSGEKFEEADVVYRQVQFLYDDGEACHFMDTQSYDQVALAHDRVEEMRPWFVEGMSLQAVLWNGSIANVSLPQYVEARVDMVGAGSRADTATGRTLKDATLENGVAIKVPLFVEAGETVLVDPRTREFIRRVRE